MEPRVTNLTHTHRQTVNEAGQMHILWSSQWNSKHGKPWTSRGPIFCLGTPQNRKHGKILAPGYLNHFHCTSPSLTITLDIASVFQCLLFMQVMGNLRFSPQYQTCKFNFQARNFGTDLFTHIQLAAALCCSFCGNLFSFPSLPFHSYFYQYAHVVL